MRTFVAATALFAASLAGCLQDSNAHAPPVPTDRYKDADVAVGDRVDGSMATTREFAVPDGKGELRVLATYNLTGSAAFQLIDPGGKVVHDDAFSGAKRIDNATWTDVEDPEPGTWTLRISVSGSGVYAFGLYATGTGTSIAGLYGDAQFHFSDRVDGSASTSKTFDVPLLTKKLTVRARYHIEGSGSLDLRDPTMIPQRSDDVAGSKDVKDGVWFEADSPLPGSWKIDVSIAGSGQYAFGVYY